MEILDPDARLHAPTDREPDGPSPRQLRDSDGVFLSVDSEQAPSCIAGLTVVDPGDDPHFGFDRYLRILRERVGLIDRFKWQLAEVPLGLDHPYWVEAPDFDPADHVQRIAVRAPGDREALAELVGLLHGLPLDRSRPLWECWWIEGLAGGRIATLLKFHHCLMDGESGIGLAEILLDLSPEPMATASAPQRDPTLRPPTRLEMASRVLANAVRRPERIVAHAGRALRGRMRSALGTRSEPPAPAVPKTPWNDRLSGRRAFAFASLPLAPLRDARKHFDVKLNDVLLELVSDAVRRVLREDDRLPADPVVAICPVSLRDAGDEGFDNQISSMPVSMATHLGDPVDRLLAIHRSADAAKARMRDGEFEVLGAMSECLVPGVLRLATRAAHAFPERLPLPGNLVFSNVRGLPVPLYLAGARVVELYPMSMLQVGTGMNVTAVSHGDQVDFGFLVDRELVPDPWRFSGALREAQTELARAIEARLAARERSRAAPPGRRTPPVTLPRSRERDTGGPTRLEGPDAPDADPLDLVQLISGLSHVRAPSRGPIGTPVAD